MEMSSAQWLLELGREDLVILGHCNDTLSELTADELETLMGYQRNLAYESGTWRSRCYPSNLKLPATVSPLEVMPSGGRLDYELRPAKQLKTSNLQDSSFLGQELFSSKVSTPPSIYVPNCQQKLQGQRLVNNYFASFFKVKGEETYENVAPTTPSIQAEILGCGGHNYSCISYVNWSHVDAFNASSGQSLEANLRISRVSGDDRHSRKVSAHTQNHIMAGKRRREKLSERFIVLSAIVPGLTKKDKATVLGDAIKYMKQLQDRIKSLEEQAPKITVQPVVYVKKTELCTDDQEGSPSSVNFSSGKHVTEETVLIPEIEARVVNRNVVIRIHCDKRKQLLVTFFAELEKLELTVVNASILSFSETTYDLTINAMMEEGCDLTVKDVAKSIQTLLKKTT